MKRRIKKNEQGFTLIELLAVIVVLAIVLLMGATAVIPRMNEARKQVLALEANTVIESAAAYFQSNSYLGGSSGASFPVGKGVECVTIKALIDEGYYDGDSSYEGVVFVGKNDENSKIYLYSVFLTNGKLMINGYGNNGTNNVDVKADNVKDEKELTYSSCTFTTEKPKPATVPKNPEY